jgi:hypothetical protein
MFSLASAAAAILLALVFLFGSTVRFRDPERRERWMSAAGGASAAYVFVVLLPKLAADQPTLQGTSSDGILRYLSHHSFLLALAGLLLFWAFDRLVVVLVEGMIDSLGGHPSPRITRSRTPYWRPVLYAQAVAFASYTTLVGYLIGASAEMSYPHLGLFTLAMALHFLGMSQGLKHELGEAYDHFERWLLAAAILAGWGLSQFAEIAYAHVALWNSLFAGMLMFFVLRHEVPSPKEGRFVPLFLGALSYSALALAIEAL